MIHRLAISPKSQGRGLAQKLMDFAEYYAVSNNYQSIRLDAYSGNKRSLDFYQKRNYIKRGEILFPNRELPFHCFEKAL